MVKQGAFWNKSNWCSALGLKSESPDLKPGSQTTWACCSLRILLSLLCLVIFNNSELFQLFLVIFWVGLKTSQQHWVIYILYLQCFSESYFFYSVLTIFSFDLQQELIKKICGENGVLVTSFSGMRQHQDHLLAQRFDYVILDEGHKIRNPDAEITLACKQVTSFQFTF